MIADMCGTVPNITFKYIFKRLGNNSELFSS
jgi:hypothetical protein